VENEWLERQEKARRLMMEKEMVALILEGEDNLAYFAGVRESSILACGVLVLPVNSRPVLAIMWHDEDGIREQSKEMKILKYANPGSRFGVLKKTVERLDPDKGLVGMDAKALAGLGKALEQNLQGLKPVDATDAIAVLRSIKSESEIAYIQKACELSDQGMQTALDSLIPGTTELEVAARAEQRMIQLGSERPKHETIVASGYRCKFIHPFASQKRIRAGDQVVTDLGATCGGYASDIARTAVLGKAGEELIRGFDLLCRLQDAVLEKLAPGVSMRDIIPVIKEVTRGSGMKLIGPIGHNVGLKVEERPFLSARKAFQDVVIQKGMILSIFSGSLQANRSLGIRLEDTILVTDSGVKRLTKHPRRLFEV
jgi:Xaa-Pro aminopeptidase